MQKTVRAWIELLFREEGAEWTGLKSINPDDYVVKGGALPVAEFEKLCGVFAMFREIPEGMEAWFERPMQSLDIIMMCRQWQGYPKPVCTSLMVLSSADIDRLDLLRHFGSELRPYKMACCNDHYTLPIKSDRWVSRLKKINT